MIRVVSAGKVFRVAGAVLLAVALAACNQGETNSTSAPSAPAASAADASVPTRSAAEVSSASSTTAPPDPFSFSAAAYSVAQDQGSVSLLVQRTGATGSAVSVSYSTANGTAAAGTDYTKTSGTLHWTENDKTPATITIPISKAHSFYGTRTFRVSLSDPSSPAQIVWPGTATVMISGAANESAGSLRLSSSGYEVAQATGSARITVDRVGGANGAVSVAYHTQSGTAEPGTNYTTKTGILQWDSGDATAKSFSIPIANATGFSGTRIFHVALSDARSGASLGTPQDAVVNINGEGVTNFVNLALSTGSYSVAQRAGSVTITVKRTGISSGSSSVAYATSSGTAAAGTNFTPKSGTLQWVSGSTAPKTFQVPINSATPFSGNKTFTVALTDPSTHASIATPGKAIVTIAGSASAAVGSLALSGAAYAVSQDAGSVTVTVSRKGGSYGAASVKYATRNGSAIAGTDYTAENGTLSWVDGGSSPHTFRIPISNAKPFAGKKSFAITLSRASGSTLGATSIATVSITGDVSAATGNLQFAADNYAVAQSSGEATVTVDRTGGSAGSISVAYATSNGTAVAGTDFTATSGTLDWADGNSSSRTVRIPVSTSTPFAGSKTFTLRLSNPTSGADLGSPTGTTVTISGSGGGSSPPSAPSNLTLVNQGGPLDYDDNNAIPNELTNYQEIEWSPATAGGYAIDHYRIYRNGAAYATISAPTQFQGYIVGNTLTVTSVISGTVTPGPRWSGSGVKTGTMINGLQASGTTGGAGTYPVNLSQTVGSPGAPVTFTGWVYIDRAAANSNDPSFNGPVTAYAYAVAAVDAAGQEGPQTSQYAAYGYQHGFSNWNGYNFDYNGAVSNYASTDGNPLGGLYDLKGTFLTGGGLNLVAGNPQAPVDDLGIGGFKYLTIDVNPGPNVNYTLFLDNITRLPPGDVFGWTSVQNVFDYGPAPVANTWATYKIPLSALGIGSCTFTGSITGSRLTVTSVDSGPAIVDAGGFITGPGIPAGTYILNYGQHGAIGTFTIAGPGINSSTRVTSETMSYQRLSYYKSTIQPNPNGPNISALYINNFGWTTN